ncbi:hypothetical protein POM88_013195 [Heracleum sosnowskyi]|uniref:Uncharacterized protein n=1 Tax=Heracleum sosnowskyi TaxID=360622 RepID=A0AAD8IZI8_9APIA|nr:hypothetical protein POM88_013195 [Heracleum sosnowskyi]
MQSGIPLLPRMVNSSIISFVWIIFHISFRDVPLFSSDATRIYANIDYTPAKDLRNAIATATGNAVENLPKPTYNRFFTAEETTLQDLTIKEILETTLPNSAALLCSSSQLVMKITRFFHTPNG